MTTRLVLTAAGLFGLAGSAAAQNPGYGGYGGGGIPPYYPPLNPANVMPNIYNPRTQPLSPYLNLTRGGNPAVNYYYGVRPGTVGGAGSIGGAPGIAAGGGRGAFLPQLAAGPIAENGDGPPQQVDPADRPVLPPAGHGATFNNTFGYFPGPAGGAAGRPGLSGVGTRRSPTSGPTPRR